MIVDPVPGAPGDVAYDGAQAGVVDVLAPATARAHDMVVVARLAGHVGVLAGRQVDAFDEVEVGQHLQGPEDGRAPDGEATLTGRIDEIRRREVTGAIGDQLRDRAPWLRHPVITAVQGGKEGEGIDHGGRIAGIRALVETESQ